MTERKMATVRKILEIKKIEGADKIQAYRVDHWWVVDQVDKYKVGDLVIYCEIDSWIPHELAPFLSRGKEPREFNGIKGERLKTIRLKGQLSQGLLLPTNLLYNFEDNEDFLPEEDLDVSEWLNITKWELSEKEFIKRYGANPQARKGGFPWYIPKSDQERIQNIKDRTIYRWIESGIEWEVTEKLEGSSLTAYVHEDDEGVCSRNINLKRPEEGDPVNPWWFAADKYDLINKLKKIREDTDFEFAIQGEIIGTGLNGNHYKLDTIEFYCYNLWDILNQKWVDPSARRSLCEIYDIPHVPVLYTNFIIPPVYNVESLIDLADGTSRLKDVPREGLVYKSANGSESFKSVSNLYIFNKSI